MGVSRTEEQKDQESVPWMLCCPWAAGVAGEMGKSPKDSKLLLPLSWPWEPVPGADTAGGATAVGMTLAATAGEGTTTSNAVEASLLRSATVSVQVLPGARLPPFFSHLQVSPEHLSGEEA